MRIAIVTPAFNVGSHIGDTIRSVIAQNWPDWTMTIVDDGSTDDTAAVAARFEDKRLRLVRQANAGVSAARNRGLAEADGEAVLFLDADDRLAPDALVRLLRTLWDCPWASASVGAYQRVGSDTAPGPVVAPPDGDLLAALVVRNRFINGGHVLIRREALEHMAPFRSDLSFGEDWEFWVRLALGGEFAAVGGGGPVLFALDRADGAYRRLAADPASFLRCLDAIFAIPGLADRFDATTLRALRRRAEAEACWVIGREMIRHRTRTHARAWLRRSALIAPSPRRVLRALAALAEPLLPAPWRGPFRPYPE
jgi:glycosyltransferase involved in cell wall biosynthesis